MLVKARPGFFFLNQSYRQASGKNDKGKKRNWK